MPSRIVSLLSHLKHIYLTHYHITPTEGTTYEQLLRREACMLLQYALVHVRRGMPGSRFLLRTKTTPQEHRAVDKGVDTYACIMPTLSLPASVNQRVWFAPTTIPTGRLA